MLKICVIDGQGGGIGSALIKKLKEEYGEDIEVIALGTNAIATSQMMKARANKGATGANAIIKTSRTAQVIIGPIGIILANAMMGEVTPEMAAAVADSPAKKILLPLSQENVEIAGLTPEPLPHLIDEIVKTKIKEMMHHV
ncbi:MAG: DUF3842 family protein [Deltaproteobacteria bacterium]|nr:DUF3842 family protein [Deltaproteobacteria bacterium]